MGTCQIKVNLLHWQDHGNCGRRTALKAIRSFLPPATRYSPRCHHDQVPGAMCHAGFQCQHHPSRRLCCVPAGSATPFGQGHQDRGPNLPRLATGTRRCSGPCHDAFASRARHTRGAAAVSVTRVAVFTARFMRRAHRIAGRADRKFGRNRQK